MEFSIQKVGIYKASNQAHTLSARDYKGATDLIIKKGQYVNKTNDVTYIVRRLIPKECARLQGFPDWWCADVPHTDSAEYKMWGNGVALPCVLYVMEGIASILNNEKGEKK